MTPTLTFPRSDTSLVRWSTNVVNLITPSPGTYNLVTADVTAYTLLHNGFVAAVAACDPSVRSKPAVVAKNAARTSLENGAKLLANKVYSSSTVTDAQKTELGMPPRQSPSPIPVPSTKPVIEIISQSGYTVRIRLRDASGARRGRPPGTAGASVFSFIGTEPPTDLSQWTFQGSTGRVEKIDLTFPPTLEAGSKVFITAFWFNGRKQSGEACDPVPVNLPGGGVAQVA